MTFDPGLLDDLAAREPDEDLGQRGGWSGAPDLAADLDLGPGYTSGVTGPGLAALNAGDGRAPRRASASAWAPPDDRGNWVLTGPRNIGGRITALTVAPPDPAWKPPDPPPPKRWFAGSASGGPYRSEDGGLSWIPLWHDETSLAVGAIAVSPENPDRVYVATGENLPAGLAVRGHGILASTNGGKDWIAQGGGPGPHPAHTRGFDAIAVDPASADHCIAVGKDGIFHTTDGGASWDHIAANVYFSDVAFFAADVVYLVRGSSVAGEGAVFRIDGASTLTTVAQFEAALANPDNIRVVAGPLGTHEAWPGRGKIALAPGSPGRAYVRFVDTAGHHLGLWSSADPGAATAAATTWTRLADHYDWPEERQGMYNLAIAVDPDDATKVATGMVRIHASRDGGTTWTRAMFWGLHGDGLRGHHADQHQLVVSAGQLWTGNDGGIACSDNWATGTPVFYSRPVPADAVRWRRRDLGIVAAQMYDLNQSPLLPGLQAMGMQDNASHMTSGGGTWRQVGAGDGSFILFDGSDPYRYFVTTQNDIRAAQFPGYHDRHFPEEQAPGAPVTDRLLEQGLLRHDPPAFVADSDRHPVTPGRVLLARRGRLYGARPETGENWRVEQVGGAIELIYEPGAIDRAEVRVVATPGAVSLGLVPGRHVARGRFEPLTDAGRRKAAVRLRSRLPAPFRLTDGDELRLELDGAARRIVFRSSDVADIGAVTVADVVRLLSAALPDTVKVLPTFWYSAMAVELVTHGIGAGHSVTLDGPAVVTTLADGLSPLGLNAGTYQGSADLPASVTLGFVGLDEEWAASSRDLSGVDRLDVGIDGGAMRQVDLTGLPDRTNVTPGELAALLRTALADDPVDVVEATVGKLVRVTAHEGHSLVAGGTAAARLGLGPHEQDTLILYGRSHAEINGNHHQRNWNSFNLTPPGPDPLELTISDGTSTAGPIRFTAGDVANLRCVTVEEIYRVVVEALDGSGVEADPYLALAVITAPPTEVVMSDAHPGEAWVGSRDGRVFRTTDGVGWSEVGSAEFRRGGSPVEAIALHPTEPGTAFVGLLSERSTGHLVTLYRTTTGGDRWDAMAGIAVDGAFVGVHAIEIDPKEPNGVFVATTGGVFRSDDGGDTWRRFDEGLPNAPVTDLAFEPATGRLRAGVWGRGSFMREVRNVSPHDARVFLRANESDDGSGRPPPALPSVFAADPSSVRHSSPDIVHVHELPAELAGRMIDGVEFDLDLVVDPAVPTATGVVAVQVHNGAALPATGVRIVVLASATDVIVPGLPSDLWSTLRAGPLTGTLGAWGVLGDVTLADSVPPSTPHVEAVPVTWPADLAGANAGVLVLVEAAGDLIEDGALTVEGLVNTERRAAYREFPVATEDEARTFSLRAAPGRQFEVQRPGSEVGTDATAELDIDGSLVADTTGLVDGLTAAAPSAATFSLPASAAVTIRQEPVKVTIDFDNFEADFADLAQATPFEVARYVQAHLDRHGAQASIHPYRVGVRLRALGGATISPTGGRVATRLGWAPGHVFQLEATDPSGFNLSGAGDSHLQLEIQAHSTHVADLTLPSDGFRDAAEADGRRIALLLNRALEREQLSGLVRAEVIHGLLMYANFNGTVAADGPAADTLQLPSQFSLAIVGPGIVDLSDGSPNRLKGQSMKLSVINGVDVRFDRYPHMLPDLSAATPSQVRRVVNEHLSLANLPVRAVVGSARLAATELATSGTSPVVVPEDLFGYHGGYLRADLDGGQENHIYLRTANRGTADAVDASIKLHLLDMGASPIARTEVAAETVTIDAETTHHVHLPFAVPADQAAVWLVATAGLDLPATDWASPDEARAWVASNRGAVLRRFTVAGAGP